MLKRLQHGPRGQTLVEMALVFPLFILVLFGTIVLGIGVFYQQQLTNAAREGARYATLHSATSQCPTVSNRDPDVALLPLPNNYYRCDPPSLRWPEMSAAARSKLFAMRPGSVQITACWSGYWTKDTAGNWAAYDQVATDSAGIPNDFRECSVQVYGWSPSENPDSDPSLVHTINPRTGSDIASGQPIRVDCSKQFPLTTVSNDMASNFSASGGASANRVTVLACYPWSPPLAGFLLIPRAVMLHAVVFEGMEYQQ